MNLLPRLALAAALATLPAFAQISVPAGQGTAFKDTSIFHVPPGSKVAILEFEDLECPACARAYPIVHSALEKYKIPIVRHDFPLKMHLWSRDAAITARYLQDKVSPQMAEEFRRDVFKSQTSLASKDDLNNYTRKWFAQHNQQMPFMIGPNSLFAAEVNADQTLGERVGLQETPTIIVLTEHGWIQIKDITQLYSVLDTAMAQAAADAKPAVHAGPKKPATAQK